MFQITTNIEMALYTATTEERKRPNTQIDDHIFNIYLPCPVMELVSLKEIDMIESKLLLFIIVIKIHVYIVFYLIPSCVSRFSRNAILFNGLLYLSSCSDRKVRERLSNLLCVVVPRFLHCVVFYFNEGIIREKIGKRSN